MRDDESGQVHYKEDMVKIWDGTWRHKKMFETRQPQEFVRARADPRALRHIRPEEDAAVPINSISGTVGDSTVVTPPGPANHLFPAGIGEMIIEGANINTVFQVR
jgi:hypothetical protein